MLTPAGMGSATEVADMPVANRIHAPGLNACQ